MLIVDTGVVLAASDSGDPDHVACAGLLEASVGPLVTTALVVAESAYLIGRQLGAAAESRFFRSIADGEITVEPLSTADDLRIAGLVEQFASLPLRGTPGLCRPTPNLVDCRQVQISVGNRDSYDLEPLSRLKT